MKRNFGQANPEGYRKALRMYELASRFGLPILTFIDTPGAYPGIGAEERGQSEAIGACLAAMARARVPIVATIIGEGGSGGALALGVANRVLVLEYGTYSVISPGGLRVDPLEGRKPGRRGGDAPQDDGARISCALASSTASSTSRRAARTRIMMRPQSSSTRPSRRRSPAWMLRARTSSWRIVTGAFAPSEPMSRKTR